MPTVELKKHPVFKYEYDEVRTIDTPPMRVSRTTCNYCGEVTEHKYVQYFKDGNIASRERGHFNCIDQVPNLSIPPPYGGYWNTSEMKHADDCVTLTKDYYNHIISGRKFAPK